MKYRELIASAFDIINEANPEKHHEFKYLEKLITARYNEMIQFNKAIFEASFKDIFKEIITSPSKKAD